MKPAILRPYHAPEVIGVAEAAQRAGRSERTIREWCALHQIGRRIGGQWAVSQTALDMFLHGDSEVLEAYLAGDRTSQGVLSYYERRSILPPSTDPGAR
jgi:helix-turn-helix protein